MSNCRDCGVPSDSEHREGCWRTGVVVGEFGVRHPDVSRWGIEKPTLLAASDRIILDTGYVTKSATSPFITVTNDIGLVFREPVLNATITIRVDRTVAYRVKDHAPEHDQWLLEGVS